MDPTSGYAMSFPVFHAQRREDGVFLIQGEIRGTALALGAEYMLTAGHVMEEMPSSESDVAVVGIAHPELGLKGAFVVNFELLGSDLALLQVRLSTPELSSSFHRFPWFVGQPPVFETVRSVGYAYGIHRVEDRQSCVVRGFQGHIVSGLLEFKPLGMEGEPFRVYELSFSAPRGLSGAPLLNAHGRPVVLGVVIGNSESRMLIFRSEERVNEGKDHYAVEQYESLQLGIAVQGAEVLSKQSCVLGTSIEDHLRSHNLLVGP